MSLQTIPASSNRKFARRAGRQGLPGIGTGPNVDLTNDVIDERLNAHTARSGETHVGPVVSKSVAKVVGFAT
jgi:hypothetical protein